MLGAEKAGHVGSLDPLATGMLPICLGEATKVAGDILSGRKCYHFTVKLGSRTATGDTEGQVTETLPVPAFSDAQLAAVVSGFLGKQRQIPPMYSALKRDGQPLYKLARQGVEVEREAREIEIFALRRLAATADTLELEAICSKGTYIRTLAEDIAKVLGTCGHVIRLRREYVEPFEGQPMATLESLADHPPPLMAADVPLGHLGRVQLDPAATARLLHGQSVFARVEGPEGRVRLYAADGAFLGIGESDGLGAIRPRRLFVV
jgi:tRNA pseudouridine55 synthase